MNSKNLVNYGKYFLNNSLIKNLEPIKNNVGFVEQELNLNPNWTPIQHFEYFYSLRWNKKDTFLKRKEDFEMKTELILDVLNLKEKRN